MLEAKLRFQCLWQLCPPWLPLTPNIHYCEIPINILMQQFSVKAVSSTGVYLSLHGLFHLVLSYRLRKYLKITTHVQPLSVPITINLWLNLFKGKLLLQFPFHSSEGGSGVLPSFCEPKTSGSGALSTTH